MKNVINNAHKIIKFNKNQIKKIKINNNKLIKMNKKYF